MNYLRNLFAVVCTLACGLLITTTSAFAQATSSVNVLDTVEVFCEDCALLMKVDDPDRTGDDFELMFQAAGANFTTCTRVPGSGLF
jgi:hypothetical protein